MAGEKFLKHDANGNLQEIVSVQVGGAPNAEKLPSLDAAGRLDITMMPTGLGSDTAVLPCLGDLAAGDFVNVFDNGGAFTVRKADASSVATAAHGFVLDAVLDGGNATVYFEGTNTAVLGMSPGSVYLSTTAGVGANAAPTGSGQIVQKIGIAVAVDQMNFEAANPIILA